MARITKAIKPFNKCSTTLVKLFTDTFTAMYLNSHLRIHKSLLSKYLGFHFLLYNCKYLFDI